MPRKPTLSPTRLTLFLACPVKYKWTYMDARGKPFLRSKSYYSFGSSLHKVLERFHDEADQGVKTTAEAVEALGESWIDAGYRSQEEMEQAQGRATEMIERYVEERMARAPGAKVVAVERRYRFDMGEFVLLGVVDRLDRYPDGRLDVVDYKSGRSDVTEREIKTDLAMGVYQLLVSKSYPDEPISATIYALRTGASATASLSPEERDEFEFDVKELGRQILGTNWDELIPVPKALCAHCDFRPLCRRYPEYDERDIPVTPGDSG